MATPSTERGIKSAGKVNFTNYDRPRNFKAGNNHIFRKLFPWLLEQWFSTGSNVALTLRGHLETSGAISGCHTWDRVLLSST